MDVAPPIIVEERGTKAVFIWCGLVAAGVVGAILYFFNPAESRFYPQCFFRVWTGWDCPGCGGLRATHQLLHGNVRQAFALNPLFVIALPLLALMSGRFVWDLVGGRKGSPAAKSPRWLWAFAVAVIAFGILRNLPWRAWLNG